MLMASKEYIYAKNQVRVKAKDQNRKMPTPTKSKLTLTHAMPNET